MDTATPSAVITEIITSIPTIIPTLTTTPTIAQSATAASPTIGLGWQILISLISGIIGSLIGGIVTYISTMKSIRATIEASARQEAERRDYQEKQAIKQTQQQREQIKDAFLAETNENLHSAAIWNQFHGKFRFSNDVWNINKAALSTFPSSLQEKLITVYSKITRYNSLIDYDLRALPGSGFYDAEIGRQVPDVESALLKLKEEIEKWKPTMEYELHL